MYYYALLLLLNIVILHLIFFLADASLYKGFNVLGLENVLPSQGISLNEEDETNQLSEVAKPT